MSEKRRVTIKDVAVHAEVALGTVSRIINGNQTVSPDLRDHVNKVIEELGYRPNASARTMRTNKTQVIGIVVTDIAQPVAAKLIASAAECVRDAGYASIIGDFHNDVGREETLLRFMSERNVDGLILTVSSDENAELVERLNQLNIPIVLWEREAKDAFPSARSDHRLGARQAAELLLGRGRTSVLLVAGHETSWTGREQIAGMTEGLAGAARLEVIHTGRFTSGKLAARLGRYDAIVANVHDIPAIMLVLKAAGKTTPGDVAVISIGDDPFLEICNPPITAIRTRPDLVGAMAARLLLAELGREPSDKMPQNGLIAPEMMVRQST